MKFIIFFFYIPLVYSELHRFITTYTEITGQMTTGTPEFSAVTTLDDHQIDYYDSNIKKLISRQDWMKNYTSTEMWKGDAEIRKHVQQIYRNNIPLLMQRFNQTHGVHTYQRMYGCEYDDETGDSRGFDQYGYDGEDFISLDLKEDRYITPVLQATPTVMKWNNNIEELKSLKQYYDYECVYWLKKFLHLSKSAFNKTEPKVSLLQKKQDNYVECHVTGFLFRDTNISWRKNGQAMNNSSNFTSGDTRPNEDGTFQRTLTLFIRPDEWKKDRFTCVVEHKSWTDPIQKSMTEDHIKTNGSALDASSIMNLTLIIIIITVIVGLIGLIVQYAHLKHRKKLIDCLFTDSKNRKTIYFKSDPSQEQAPSQVSLLSTPSIEDKMTPTYFKSEPSQEQAPAQVPLLSNPSIESSSPPEDDKMTTTYFKSEPSQEQAPAQVSLLSNPSNEDNKMTPIYHKSEPLQEQAPVQVPLLSNPSNESSSPPEDGIYKMTPTYFKSEPSQEQAPVQVPLLSNPSIESSSPPEDGICESAAPLDSSTEMNMITLQNLPSSSPVDGSSQPFPTTQSFCKVQETSKDL